MTAVEWPGDGGGLRLLVDGGVFFEFIPREEVGAAEPARLSLGEVEPGRVYELALSTNGGIWAYRVGDLVRVVSVSPPVIRFAGCCTGRSRRSPATCRTCGSTPPLPP